MQEAIYQDKFWLAKRNLSINKHYIYIYHTPVCDPPILIAHFEKYFEYTYHIINCPMCFTEVPLSCIEGIKFNLELLKL